MRERRDFNISILTKPRITPAYAGKTAFNSSPVCPAEDHPRVCGKDLARAKIAVRCVGSPPRMRERLSYALGVYKKRRITPAYAGKT